MMQDYCNKMAHSKTGTDPCGPCRTMRYRHNRKYHGGLFITLFTKEAKVLFKN